MAQNLGESISLSDLKERLNALVRNDVGESRVGPPSGGYYSPKNSAENYISVGSPEGSFYRTLLKSIDDAIKNGGGDVKVNVKGLSGESLTLDLYLFKLHNGSLTIKIQEEMGKLKKEKEQAEFAAKQAAPKKAQENLKSRDYEFYVYDMEEKQKIQQAFASALKNATSENGEAIKKLKTLQSEFNKEHETYTSQYALVKTDILALYKNFDDLSKKADFIKSVDTIIEKLDKHQKKLENFYKIYHEKLKGLKPLETVGMSAQASTGVATPSAGATVAAPGVTPKQDQAQRPGEDIMAAVNPPKPPTIIQVKLEEVRPSYGKIAELYKKIEDEQENLTEYRKNLSMAGKLYGDHQKQSNELDEQLSKLLKEYYKVPTLQNARNSFATIDKNPVAAAQGDQDQLKKLDAAKKIFDEHYLEYNKKLEGILEKVEKLPKEKDISLPPPEKKPTQAELELAAAEADKFALTPAGQLADQKRITEELSKAYYIETYVKLPNFGWEERYAELLSKFMAPTDKREYETQIPFSDEALLAEFQKQRLVSVSPEISSTMKKNVISNIKKAFADFNEDPKNQEGFVKNLFNNYIKKLIDSDQTQKIGSIRDQLLSKNQDERNKGMIKIWPFLKNMDKDKINEFYNKHQSNIKELATLNVSHKIGDYSLSPAIKAAINSKVDVKKNPSQNNEFLEKFTLEEYLKGKEIEIQGKQVPTLNVLTEKEKKDIQEDINKEIEAKRSELRSYYQGVILRLNVDSFKDLTTLSPIIQFKDKDRIKKEIPDFNKLQDKIKNIEGNLKNPADVKNIEIKIPQSAFLDYKSFNDYIPTLITSIETAAAPYLKTPAKAETPVSKPATIVQPPAAASSPKMTPIQPVKTVEPKTAAESVATPLPAKSTPPLVTRRIESDEIGITIDNAIKEVGTTLKKRKGFQNQLDIHMKMPEYGKWKRKQGTEKFQEVIYPNIKQDLVVFNKDIMFLENVEENLKRMANDPEIRRKDMNSIEATLSVVTSKVKEIDKSTPTFKDWRRDIVVKRKEPRTRTYPKIAELFGTQKPKPILAAETQVGKAPIPPAAEGAGVKQVSAAAPLKPVTPPSTPVAAAPAAGMQAKPQMPVASAVGAGKPTVTATVVSPGAAVTPPPSTVKPPVVEAAKPAPVVTGAAGVAQTPPAPEGVTLLAQARAQLTKIDKQFNDVNDLKQKFSERLKRYMEHKLVTVDERKTMNETFSEQLSRIDEFQGRTEKSLFVMRKTIDEMTAKDAGDSQGLLNSISIRLAEVKTQIADFVADYKRDLELVFTDAENRLKAKEAQEEAKKIREAKEAEEKRKAAGATGGTTTETGATVVGTETKGIKEQKGVAEAAAAAPQGAATASGGQQPGGSASRPQTDAEQVAGKKPIVLTMGPGVKPAPAAGSQPLSQADQFRAASGQLEKDKESGSGVGVRPVEDSQGAGAGVQPSSGARAAASGEMMSQYKDIHKMPGLKEINEQLWKTSCESKEDFKAIFDATIDTLKHNMNDPEHGKGFTEYLKSIGLEVTDQSVEDWKKQAESGAVTIELVDKAGKPRVPAEKITETFNEASKSIDATVSPTSDCVTAYLIKQKAVAMDESKTFSMEAACGGEQALGVYERAKALGYPEKALEKLLNKDDLAEINSDPSSKLAQRFQKLKDYDVDALREAIKVAEQTAGAKGGKRDLTDDGLPPPKSDGDIRFKAKKSVI